MAADGNTERTLSVDSRGRLLGLHATLFEAVLLGATLFGIVSLCILFGYIAFDAFRPLTASIRWYLLFAGTLVLPTTAFTLYARRRPAVRSANTKAFGAVGGALTVTLSTYIVVDALSPYDVVLCLLFGGYLPVVLWLIVRRTKRTPQTGLTIILAAVGGLAVAHGGYDLLRPIVGIAAQWIAYFGIVTLPVACGLWIFGRRRWSRQTARRAALSALGVVLLIVALALGLGIDPSFWVVVLSAFVIPVAVVIGEIGVTDPAGRIGSAGPFVLVGGLSAFLAVERQLGIDGPDGYLTATLLLESWHGLNASSAGVYPQIVGSIVTVGVMGVLAFPIGIGGALYLEEYAPRTGWSGRFATLLEVNISNLAGVPSVVYGLLGLALFRNALGFPTGIVLSAAGTLGLLILPIVVVSAQEALRSVPDSLREAAFGMGASRWQTLRTVVLPEAIPGMLTGTILALARAIGETAPLVIIAVATTKYSPPDGVLSSATVLPLQIFAARSNVDPAFRHGIVPAAAVVLLVLLLLMNTAAIVVRNRFDRRSQ
ncbi:phosphate ABC transporter permease PstA [Halocatena halophila]|uniref:phosphate ABC transporter permease PstA n=1 Tax=Halocatena halophila TaxID=2814576 RepID=UPI002ED0E641